MATSREAFATKAQAPTTAWDIQTMVNNSVQQALATTLPTVISQAIEAFAAKAGQTGGPPLQPAAPLFVSPSPTPARETSRPPARVDRPPLEARDVRARLAALEHPDGRGDKRDAEMLTIADESYDDCQDESYGNAEPLADGRYFS